MSSTFTLEDAAHIVEPRVRARRDAVCAHHAAEAARSRGVCMSGMGPDPWREPTEAEIAAEIAAGIAKLVSWRQTPTSALLAAVSTMSGELENIRALVSRAGVPDRLAEGPRDQAGRLAAALRAALDDVEVALADMEPAFTPEPRNAD